MIDIEQIIKADRNVCHALCGKGKARASLRQLSSTVKRIKDKKMKQIISILWSIIFAVTFSALIHSTDSNIGSMGAAFTPSNIISVLIISLILVWSMLLCLLSFRHRGWKGFIITLLLISTVFGTILAFVGSTAQTSDEMAVSMLGAGGLFVCVLGLGSFPHVITTFQKLKSV
jgi:hypothetical protein